MQEGTLPLVRWMTVFWKQATRMAAVPSCIAVPIIRSPPLPHELVQGADGQSWYAMSTQATVPQFADGAGNEAYNQALFGQFMPSFDQPIQSIDTSRASDGVLEVRHQDGSGTAFYDRTMYQTPEATISRCRILMADSGMPSAARLLWSSRPVYQDGKPVYDGDKLRTYQVESVRYKTTPYSTQGARPPQRLSRSGGPVRKT